MAESGLCPAESLLNNKSRRHVLKLMSGPDPAAKQPRATDGPLQRVRRTGGRDIPTGGWANGTRCQHLDRLLFPLQFPWCDFSALLGRRRGARVLPSSPTFGAGKIVFFNFIILYSAVLGHDSLNTLLFLTPPDTEVPGPAGFSPLPTIRQTVNEAENT